jgi:hypothetical protein
MSTPARRRVGPPAPPPAAPAPPAAPPPAPAAAPVPARPGPFGKTPLPPWAIDSEARNGTSAVRLRRVAESLPDWDPLPPEGPQVRRPAAG